MSPRFATSATRKRVANCARPIRVKSPLGAIALTNCSRSRNLEHNAAFNRGGFEQERKKLKNTHFSPSTSDFAFASNVRRQRFISDSGTRTALLTVLTTRDAALPSEFPES